MAENDTLTYHVKKTSHHQAITAESALITQERTQKLDLLMHLLANLEESLVICGPAGIGKTTFLQVLQARRVNAWLYCLAQGSADLSFEKILQQLTGSINHEKPKADLSLPDSLRQFESHNKKIILMIDDAGALVPGLITTLIQYAAANPVLKIIFALTHDDLYIKYGTDRAVEDCHFVEIPPLSEKQCGEFLQQLFAKSSAPFAYRSIGDSHTEKIYRVTHGIPGKIIAELPDLANPGISRSPTSILISAVAALVLIALGIQWYSSANKLNGNLPAAAKGGQLKAKPAPLPHDSKPSVALSLQPLFISEPLAQQNKTGILSEHPQQTNEPISQQAGSSNVDNYSHEANSNGENKSIPNEPVNADHKGLTPDKALQMDKNKASVSPASTSVLPSQSGQLATNVASDAEPSEAAAATGGVSWITEQPPGNVTLQVMVLSKEQAVKDMMQKYSALDQTLTFIKTVSANGREKYLLLYGSFDSAGSAYQARRTLPAEFRKAYARSFSSLKKLTESSR